MNMNLKTSIFNPKDKSCERTIPFDEKDKSSERTIPLETEILYVPFDQKDNAKDLGAKWDPATKSWVCDIQNKSLMDKYKKRYIKVSYDDKDKAKENGCKWEKDSKKWYTYNSNTAY